MTIYVRPARPLAMQPAGIARAEARRLKQLTRGKDRAPGSSRAPHGAEVDTSPARGPDRAAANSRAPRRIQLRRTRGWRIPEGAVKVDRSTDLGNPFVVVNGNRNGAVAQFRQFLGTADRAYTRDGKTTMYPSDAEIRERLAGRDLACWCPVDQACHADVLLKIANRGAV